MTSTSKIKNTKSLLFIAVALGLSSLVYSGCSKGFSGKAQANSRPEVRFVNVPPDGSVFSSNPIVNWIGTDSDGRIVEFRYAIVKVNDIPAGMSPEQFATDSIPLAEWTIKEVTLDDPASRDTISLEADFANPVTVFVKQYVFLLAIDDKGATSTIIYRTFGRNDHFPETTVTPPFAPGGAFVNVLSQQFNLGGIPLDWTGGDPLDFPGLEEGIPLEYEWKFYGPYTQAESTLIMDSFLVPVFVATTNTFNVGDTLIDTTFDFTKTDTLVDSTFSHPPDSLGNTLDSFLTVSVEIVKIDTLKIDTTAAQQAVLEDFGAFETIVDLAKVDSLDAPGKSRLIRFSFDPASGDTWTNETSVNFFDVFRDDPNLTIDGDTTRQNSFLFWVRSRDDAFVPDPAPAFTMLPVINPKHERDLLVVNFSAVRDFKNHNGVFLPCGVAADVAGRVSYGITKSAFASYVNGWIPGFAGGDGNSGFDTGSFAPCGDDSLTLPIGEGLSKCVTHRRRSRGTSPDFLTYGIALFNTIYQAKLSDILKHKVVIYYKENLQTPFGFGQDASNVNQFLIQGILSGNNFWTLARSPFQNKTSTGALALFPYQYGIDGSNGGLSPTYAQLFGIQGGFESAWIGMAGSRKNTCDALLGCFDSVRTEDFIGAVPSELVSSAEFPPLSLDVAKLETLLFWYDSLTCSSNKFRTQQFPWMDSIAALPDVGFTIPITAAGTETLYLYKSRFGEAKYPFWNLPFGDMQGTVVAVRLDGGFFRTSHWQFTPLTLNQEEFQPAFNTMMDWLFARPWNGPSFGSPVQPVAPPSGKYASQYIELSRTVENTRQTMLNEAFAGKRYFKNQLEYEQQLKDYLQMKRIEEAAESQSY